MLNLEVGGGSFAACLQKEHKAGIFHAHNPCSFLKRLNLWLPYLLLQHPHWNPEEQRAHLTLFKIILEAVFF